VNWKEWSHVAIVVGGALGVGIVLRLLLKTVVARWAARTQTEVDDQIVKALSGRVIFWALLWGLIAALPLVHLPDRLESYLTRASLALFLFSVTWLIADITNALVPLTARRFELLVSRQIDVGDFVEVERGGGYTSHKGYVTDVNWRFSRIRSLGGTFVDIPNSFLTQSIIRQFTSPTDGALVPVDIQLGAKADLPQAEKLARVVAGEVAQTGARLRDVYFLSGREPIIMTLVFATPAGFEQGPWVSSLIARLRPQLAAANLL